MSTGEPLPGELGVCIGGHGTGVDVAALAALTERLGAHRMLGIQFSRLPQKGSPPLYWHVRIRWNLDEYRADGDTLGEAWARAWQAALKGETLHE